MNRDERYNRSEKGRARSRRYEATARARAVRYAYEETWRTPGTTRYRRMMKRLDVTIDKYTPGTQAYADNVERMKANL